MTAKARRNRALAAAQNVAIDITPLRVSRNFRLLWTGQAISNVGRQITIVAMPFQVFLLTRSSLAVGLLGIAQVIPYVLVSLVAGAWADRFDRRQVLIWAQLGLTACSTLLMLGAIEGHPAIFYIYLIAAVASAISAVDLPARAATTPNIVPRQHLAAALSLNFAQFQVAVIAGPAVGGVVIAQFGIAWGYAIDVVTFAAAIAAAIMLTPQPVAGVEREPTALAVARGLKFAWRQKPILGGFTADIGAMVFGMPRALFPAMAINTFHGGAGVLGLLYAAPGVGAVLGSLASGFVGRLRHIGRAVLIGASVWGLGIAGFGLSDRVLWLGLACLAVAGAADAISAICRGTMLQLASPDNLRGRMSAINSMVVVSGPYLGDFRAGATGTILGAEPALVAGGVACVAVSALVAALMPRMRDYDAQQG